jgi:hypothetical protein
VARFLHYLFKQESVVMKYQVTILHGSIYEILADNLLDLHNQIQKLKKKHCLYDDEITSIEVL